MKGIRIFRVFLAAYLIFNMLGCEAFVRKFTRKPKNEPQIEIVPAPVEYVAPFVSKEERYRRSYLYWQSWHDELIEALTHSTNHKKRIDCIEQVIKNLVQLRDMVSQEGRKKLDSYLTQVNELMKDIKDDIYGSNTASERMRAERLERNIRRDCVYGKMKGFIS